MRKPVLTIAALACLLAGAVSFSDGAYMKGKAMLGDALLDIAWQRSLAAGEPVKPWPGADMEISARLTFPRLGESAVVLDSAISEAMAWGVGHVGGTAKPGEPGLAAFGGHKDSHFAFLEHAKPGDEIILENSDGIRAAYRVTDGYVVDSRHWRFPVVRQGASRLALSTCWPFGSQSEDHRFILFAERASEDSPKGGGAPVSSTQPQPGGRAGGLGSPARSPSFSQPEKRPDST